MNKGFTILEMLVACVLLGMLTTILTMVFNQSSVSWRLGTAVVADMDDVRDNIAEIREEADNAFVCNGRVHRLLGPWSSDNQLRKRACDAEGFAVGNDTQNADRYRARVLESKIQTTAAPRLWTPNNLVSVGQTSRPGNYDTYTVNVMSGGPMNDVDDWRAIWSYPDDFE